MFGYILRPIFGGLDGPERRLAVARLDVGADWPEAVVGIAHGDSALRLHCRQLLGSGASAWLSR